MPFEARTARILPEKRGVVDEGGTRAAKGISPIDKRDRIMFPMETHGAFPAFLTILENFQILFYLGGRNTGCVGLWVRAVNGVR